MPSVYLHLSIFYTTFVVFLVFILSLTSRQNGIIREQESEESQLVAPFIDLNITNHFLEKMQNRRRNIQVVCKSLYMNETDKNLIFMSAQNRILINKKHSISWCPIYKAASTVWYTNFLMLYGDYPYDLSKIRSHQVLRVYRKDRTLINYLNRTRKFLIVRHPFQRLLSAYRDKLENKTNREYYYEKFGKVITFQYGGGSSSRTLREPTFEEFLRFIANEKRFFNEHWRPFYRECAPCSIDYDFIVKLEYFHDENKALIEELGVADILEVDLRKNGNQRGRTNREIETEYFSKVPRELLEKIHTIYLNDFLLFGYAPGLYFEMASKNKK